MSLLLPALSNVRRARPHWLVAGIAAAVLLACPGPANASGLKAVWGQQLSDYPLYRQLGASIDELQLTWSDAALRRPSNARDPHDPAYTWPADVDKAVAQAARYHMRVALLIQSSPSWANGGRPSDWAPDPRDYANFAIAAARHYPSVHLWMVWSEPTRIPQFFPETHVQPFAPLTPQQAVGPHLYARMLDATYGALKRVSRRNLIVGGMTYTTGDITTQQWIENLRLPNGRPPRMDLYGHNPFSFRDPSFSNPPGPDGAVDFSDLPRLARWLDRYLPQPGHRKLPLFLVEFTVPTAPSVYFNTWVDPPVAAKWISDALRLMHHWSRIYALGYVGVRDNPPLHTGGLLTVDGQKKPGFFAFANG